MIDNQTTQTKIPSKNDWGDISDPDVYWSYNTFSGNAKSEFYENYYHGLVDIFESLSVMPDKVFAYYIFGLIDFLKSDHFKASEKYSAAYHFLDLILRRVEARSAVITDLYSAIKPTVDFVVENQFRFDADEDIYGRFSDMARIIEHHVERNSRENKNNSDIYGRSG